MALRFCDSFDSYSTAQITRKWTATGVGTAPTINSGGGRLLGNSFKATSDGTGLSKTIDAQATWIVGVAFKINSIGLGNHAPIVLVDTSTSQLTVKLNANLTLSVLRGTATGTVLGTSTFSIKLSSWYYIELKATINNTTGSYELRVNGINILSGTGANTRNTANNSANVVQLGNGVNSGNSINVEWDDFYACDSTGSVNNDFLGDIKVETLYPSANGNSTAWTPSTGVDHAALIDETPANDDTDYVSDSVANDKDSYAFADLVTTAGTIKGVQVGMCARKDDAGTRTIASMIRQSSTDYVSGTNHNLTTSYAYYNTVYDTNPATSSAFTISEINADEFGLQLIA